MRSEYSVALVEPVVFRLPDVGNEKEISKDEAIQVVTKIADRLLNKLARFLPKEQREEAKQEMYLRILEYLPDFSRRKNWKGMIYTHCRGAILDYIKRGSGFQEHKKSSEKAKANKSPKIMKSRITVNPSNENGTLGDAVDRSLYNAGEFINPEKFLINDFPNIDWLTLYKLASVNRNVFIITLWLKGNSITEIGKLVGLTEQRIDSIRLTTFRDLKLPRARHEPYWRTLIHALGLDDVLDYSGSDWSLKTGLKMCRRYKPVQFNKPPEQEFNCSDDDLTSLINYEFAYRYIKRERLI
jgi:DNA-directed RNA polymerase specialized sigma24 family protein